MSILILFRVRKYKGVKLISLLIEIDSYKNSKIIMLIVRMQGQYNNLLSEFINFTNSLIIHQNTFIFSIDSIK